MYFDELYREMYHYIYMIKFNTGQFYIGSRTSKLPPEKDTKYWGSPKTFKHLWEDTSLEKTKHIIKVCEDVEEKRKIEPKLIKVAWDQYPDLCLNASAWPAIHPDVAREIGKKNKELGLGIHGLTKEQRTESGKKGSQIWIEMYAREFTLRSPTGEIISGKNIAEFSRKYNLHAGLLREVIIEKRYSHKGWTLPNTNLEICNPTLKKQTTLKSPEGKIITEESISSFCKKYNLDSSAILKVLSKKYKHHKGWTLPNIELCDYTAIGKQPKEFTLRSPTGEIVKGKNINKFAEENNLHAAHLGAVINGKLKRHKGWSLPDTTLFGGDAYAIEFSLKSPTGEIIKSRNVAKFCRENNLIEGCIWAVLTQKRISHKGWTLPNPKKSKVREGRKFSLLSPEGELFTGNNLKEFCKNKNINADALYMVLNGQRKSHKGWTLP
jgi:Mor family transcriptional regulator